MALEKMVAVGCGIGLSLFLAGRALAQTVEHVPDSTGKMQTIVNYGNIRYNSETKETSYKNNTGYWDVYNKCGNKIAIEQDAGDNRRLIDPKTGKMIEVPVMKVKKSIDDKIGNSARLKPKSTYELGNDAFSKGDYQTAMNKYQDILQKTKNTSLKVDLLYQIGLCYDNLKNSDEACKQYEQATQIGEKLLAQGKYDPKKLAQIYAQNARGPPWANMLNLIEKAKKLDSNNSNFYDNHISAVKLNMKNFPDK